MTGVRREERSWDKVQISLNIQPQFSKLIMTLKEAVLCKSHSNYVETALFSATHLMNSIAMHETVISTQVVATFAMGMGFGILKESKAELLGSIESHHPEYHGYPSIMGLLIKRKRPHFKERSFERIRHKYRSFIESLPKNNLFLCARHFWLLSF